MTADQADKPAPTPAALDLDGVVVADGPELVEACKLYIVRHWRGELSFAKTFWVNWIAVAFVGQLFVDLLGNPVQSSFSGDSSTYSWAFLIFALIFLLIVLVILIAVTVWQIVGLWRVSTAHWPACKGFWGNVARRLCILGAMSASGAIASFCASVIAEVASITY